MITIMKKNIWMYIIIRRRNGKRASLSGTGTERTVEGISEPVN